jgi:hypothetical protein
MAASGEVGFEGFIRDCLQESLAVRFRLMKSGPQDGADMRSDGPANLLQVAVEGKRYGNATALPTEQIQLKIVSAAQSGPGPDLWVLATTRAISATDRGKFAETGDKHGVATAVLDASDGADRPSALDLLAANAPRAFAKHFPALPQVGPWLDELRGEDDFADRIDRVLEPFRRTDVGYAAARDASAAWLVTALADEATARARLDSFAGLDAEGAIVIPRLGVEEQLDLWLESGPAAPLSILGDEGVGKTWSLLDWWRRRMRETPDRLPLTLIVAANAIAGVGNVGGPDLIARLLAERFPIRGQEFWRRRLALWAKEVSTAPRVLLVIDGLNQQPEFARWHQIIQPMFDSDWNGLFAAAVTCRTAWWEDDLKSLPTVLPGFRTVRVPVFDEAELGQILGRFDLERSQFSPEMQEILAIPRYCQLAIRRRRELVDSGDITIERLIYEDWRHRIARVGSSLSPSEEEFRAFITELGLDFRSALDGEAPTLSRREMIDALDRDMGRGEPALRTALSEIVDGNWMQRTPDGSGRFTLNTRYVPFALALALHRELRVAGPTAASDRLATFMDPLRGTDRGTAILRNAVTIALLDPGSTHWIFTLLIDTWFNQQNFGPGDATALGQLAPAAPERFLAFAERLWSGERHHVRDDSVLVGSLVRAAGTPSFSEALQQTLTTWLSRVELHASRLPLGDRASEEALRGLSDAMDADAAEWAAARSQLSGNGGIQTISVTHHQGGGDQKRLRVFAAGVLSFLPRADFSSCYVAWALSRTVERDTGESAVEWSLRVNAIDPLEGSALILETATNLARSSVSVVAATGLRLLDALATPAAGLVAADLGATQYAPRATRGVEVNDNGVVKCVSSPGIGLREFGWLQRDALLPDRELAQPELEALRQAADSFDVSEYLASGRSRSSADIDFEQAEAALARWAPDQLAAIVRRAYGSAAARLTTVEKPGEDDPEPRVFSLVDELRLYWPVLGDVEMSGLQPVVARFLPAALEQDAKTDPWLRLQIPRLFGLTAAEQIELLASDPRGPNFFEADVGVFAPLEPGDFAQLSELLAGEWGVHWLGYLLFVDHEKMPDDFEALYPHVGSEDPIARRRALQIFRYAPSAQRYRWLVDSGWSWNDQMEVDEGVAGSLVLLHASATMAVPNIENRVDPEIWGALLAEDPDDEAALERFTRYLIDGIQNHRFPNGAFGRIHWLNQDDAIRIAVSRNGNRIVASIDAMVADNPQHAFGFDSFPVVDLLTALNVALPSDAARLWNALWEPYLASSWTLSKFEQAPFAGSDELLRPLQDRVLEAALADADVETVVSGALELGHEAWLIERLDRLLAGASAGEIAKGLTIARFLDPSPAADDAWRRIDAMALSNWLSKIRDQARQEYDLGRTAASCAERFLAASDADEALAALTLFTHAADAAAFEALKRSVRDGYGDLSRVARAFWLEWEEKLKTAAKKNSNGRDKRYLFEEPPKLTHHPWRT